MKKFFLIFICFTTSFLSKAQIAPLFQWADNFESSIDVDGRSVTVDASGNVYTTGIFVATTDFDPGVGVYTLTPVGNGDVFIVKLNSAGNLIWVKTLGGADIDQSFDLTVDANGNIYTIGYFKSTSDFDPGIGVYNLTAPPTLQDIFISKLDAAGNFVWAKQCTGTGTNWGYSIKVDAIGNIYTCGYFEGTTDFDPGVTVNNLTSTGFFDTFISKLDATGNFVWAKKIGGLNSIGRAFSLALDAGGNVYTTGNYLGTLDFDPGVGVYTIAAVANLDAFVSKLDASGNFVWAKSFGGTNDEYAKSIAIDAAGNVLTTGSFNGNTDFDPGAGVYALTPNGYDAFISKLDASGNFVWAKKIGGGFFSDENGLSISLDALGNVYTTGDFSGPADFDPGVGIYNLSTNGSSDIFISKLTSAGIFDWARSIGAAGSDFGKSIYVDGTGFVHTVGSYMGTVDFDPNPGVFNLTSPPQNAIFIQKMGQCTVLTATVNFQNATCGANGSATITPNGGGAFSYSWSPSGGNTNIANNLNANSYSCLITNSCGISLTKTLSITQPPALSLTAIANNTLVCAGNASTLVANGSGGVGAITYTWVGGPVNYFTVVNPTVTSIYTISISDANNCIKTQTVSVATNSAPAISVNSGSICTGNTFTITPSGANTYTFSGGSAIVSPTTNTSYSITGTAPNGCISLAPSISNVTVSAFPLPTITVNSGSICIGNSFTIVPNGANTYTISGGSTIVSPSINTNYTITGSSIAGCFPSAPAISNIIVNILLLPSMSATSNNTLICPGESATLTANGANTYTWDPGIVGANISVSPSVTTDYTVTGTSIYGCTNTLVVTQSVSICEGIIENSSTKTKTKIYPNPNEGNFFIELQNPSQIAIYDMLGKLIYNKNNIAGTSKISITDFTKGVYFIKVIDQGKTETIRLIVE